MIILCTLWILILYLVNVSSVKNPHAPLFSLLQSLKLIAYFSTQHRFQSVHRLETGILLRRPLEQLAGSSGPSSCYISIRIRTQSRALKELLQSRREPYLVEDYVTPGGATELCARTSGRGCSGNYARFARYTAKSYRVNIMVPAFHRINLNERQGLSV